MPCVPGSADWAADGLDLQRNGVGFAVRGCELPDFQCYSLCKAAGLDGHFPVECQVFLREDEIGCAFPLIVAGYEVPVHAEVYLNVCVQGLCEPDCQCPCDCSLHDDALHLLVELVFRGGFGDEYRIVDDAVFCIVAGGGHYQGGRCHYHFPFHNHITCLRDSSAGLPPADGNSHSCFVRD